MGDWASPVRDCCPRVHLGRSFRLHGIRHSGCHVCPRVQMEARHGRRRGRAAGGDAIAAGIFNDMGSGSNVDLVVIRPNNNVEMLRGYDEANVKGTRRQKYTYKKGTTEVLNTTVRHIKLNEDNTEGRKLESMDTE